jgi:hypothetical protein
MRRNGLLGKLYDRLTPEERFRLDVVAMARGDTEESELLTNTCPRRSYTMNERGFTGRWLGAMDVTLRAYLDLAGYLEKLKMVEVVRVMLPYPETFARDAALDAYIKGHRDGARHAWSEAGKWGEAPEWPLEVDEEGVKSLVDPGASILPEIFDRLEWELATNALTLWAGFERFCGERMGLEAEAILKVVLEEGVERVGDLKALAERLSIEPQTETVEEIAEGLAEAWGLVERAG